MYRYLERGTEIRFDAEHRKRDAVRGICNLFCGHDMMLTRRVQQQVNDEGCMERKQASSEAYETVKTKQPLAFDKGKSESCWTFALDAPAIANGAPVNKSDWWGAQALIRRTPVGRLKPSSTGTNRR